MQSRDTRLCNRVLSDFHCYHYAHLCPNLQRVGILYKLNNSSYFSRYRGAAPRKIGKIENGISYKVMAKNYLDPGLFYLRLRKVSAKERRRYIGNGFFHWLTPFSDINTKHDLATIHTIASPSTSLTCFTPNIYNSAKENNQNYCKFLQDPKCP